MEKDVKSKRNSINNALIVTETDVPVLRAGVGNVFFPASILLFIVALGFSLDNAYGIVIWLIAILLYVKIILNYINCVSKIYFNNDRIVIIKPIHSTTIQTSEIIRTELNCHRLNSSIWISFKIKDKLFMSSCNFTVMKETNFGDYVETVHQLRRMLKQYDVPGRGTGRP